jgi:hypothetical protein
MDNFRILHERFPNKTIMPVVHGRNSVEIELSLALLAKIIDNPPWIGLGGVVPLLKNRRVRGLKTSPETFIGDALKLIRAAYSQSYIHVFGAGGTRTFPAIVALGGHSGDSIGWRQAAGFGSIFLPMRSQRVVRWTPEKKPPRKLLDETDLATLERCNCPICLHAGRGERVSILQKHFHGRSIHNAWTLVNQHRYWPLSLGELRKAIEGGTLGRRWASALASNPIF